jgi:peroxiredoxin
VHRLQGVKLPDVELAATDGSIVNPSQLQGLSVIFCYPYTGKPGVPDPAGWDDIPGAHGSTPQALAYSEIYAGFRNQDVKLFGLSFQSTKWQIEFAQRTLLRFPLLSDEKRAFSNALKLEILNAGPDSFLKRITLIARHAVIADVRDAIDDPAGDAREVLALLEVLNP